MALRIELNGYKPGIAKFLAYKWNGSADIEILIQRNQDSYYLSGLNQWSPEKSWHTLADMTVEHEQLTGLVGEWLVDSLLTQESTARFLVQIRDKQNENYSDRGVINIADGVMTSAALNTVTTTSDTHLEPEECVDVIPDDEKMDGETQTIYEPEIEEPVEPVVEEVVTSVPTSETVTDETLTQPIKQKRKSGLIFGLIIAILLLIVMGIAIWYFLFFQNQQAKDAEPAMLGQCSLSQVGDDDLTFIQKCLQTKPLTPMIIQLINDAKKAKKCNIAQRLYANQSQVNSTIAILYAKEYDEKYYQANSCFEADKETAIYWYETALNNDPDNKDVKARLAELQK
ncbi:hypothetical protein [Gilliamella sp. CG25]|uniref:hypothetical protein n=1 Tax=unclassified Gilliamella TaxID=2685620 RepID=UPI00398583B4